MPVNYLKYWLNDSVSVCRDVSNELIKSLKVSILAIVSLAYDPDWVKCLVYREDSMSKTHDGGISDHKSDRKEVWIYPHINSDRCTVRLVEK